MLTIVYYWRFFFISFFVTYNIVNVRNIIKQILQFVLLNGALLFCIGIHPGILETFDCDNWKNKNYSVKYN